MKKYIALANMGIILIAAISGFTGCNRPKDTGLSEEKNSERVYAVSVMTVTPDTFVEYGEYIGEAHGIVEVSLTAGGKGRVESVFASEGDYVKKGQSLAEIDPEQARVMHQTAILNENLAKKTYEREKSFLEQGNSFQIKVDQAHIAWMQARTALLDAERLREASFAITPISGIVVRRYIEPHIDLENGDPTFDVADLSRIRIRVDVPETDITGVRKLEKAEVVFLSFPDQIFSGTPTGFARARSDQSLSYEVDVVLNNPDNMILSGQTAKVRLALRQLQKSITVPSRALIIRENATYVLAVRNGIAHEVPVYTGVTSNTETVITAGLSDGDQIVIEGLNRLAHGASVVIQN